MRTGWCLFCTVAGTKKVLYFDTFFSLVTKPEKINVGDSSSSTKLFLDEISQKEIAVGKVEDIVKPSTPAFKSWIWSHGCTLPWLQGLLNKINCMNPLFLPLSTKKRLQKLFTQGCRDGAVVKALTSQQCGLGSIPRSDFICGLSSLVLYSALRGFLPVLQFPLSSTASI